MTLLLTTDNPASASATDEFDLISRRLFMMVGFTMDGRTIARPPLPLTLWRGATPERRTGWSWTDHRAVAVSHASRAPGRPAGKVWRAEVEPWRLLAGHTGRDAYEYVVDTHGLTIVEDSGDLGAATEGSTR